MKHARGRFISKIILLFERERKKETDILANATQEVAASVFPLADYPSATWWHCWFQFALWSRGRVVSWSNHNKLVSGLHEELHLGLTAFIETSACLYSCHPRLKMENSIVNALLEPPLAFSPNTEIQPFLKVPAFPVNSSQRETPRGRWQSGNELSVPS